MKLKRFYGYAVLFLYLIGGITLYQISPVGVALKHLIFSMGLLFLWRANFLDGVYFRFEPPLLLFFILWGWLLLVSLYNGFIGSGWYFTYFRRAGLKAFIWIFDRNFFWGILFVLGIYLIIETDLRENLSEFLYWGYILIFTFGLLFGYLSYLFQYRWLDGRTFRILSNWHTITSILINLFLLFCLAGVIEFSSKVKQVLLLLIYYVGYSAVVLTTSRGGMGTFFIGTGLFLMLYLFKNCSFKNLLLSLLLLAICVGIFFILPGPVQKSLGDEVKKSKTARVQSGRARKIWPWAFEMFSNRPFLGHARGTYYSNVKNIYSLAERESRTFTGQAHSVFLQILYNGGILGFAIFVVFSFIILRTSLKNYFEKHRQNIFHLALACTFFSVFWVHGIVESVNFGYLALLMNWFLIAESFSGEKTGFEYSP